MRLTLTLENKYLVIDIMDLDDAEDGSDEDVSITEDQHVVLPFGFHAGPETITEDGNHDEDEDEAAPEVDCR